ncbi:hypothetical protein LXA43DRAFT_246599 [Ganoderma leucocontextum]|nr:hypothetical protein LXA43DRAFT_246599 [Ganoderma leucocontextum]
MQSRMRNAMPLLTTPSASQRPRACHRFKFSILFTLLLDYEVPTPEPRRYSTNVSIFFFFPPEDVSSMDTKNVDSEAAVVADAHHTVDADAPPLWAQQLIAALKSLREERTAANLPQLSAALSGLADEEAAPEAEIATEFDDWPDMDTDDTMVETDGDLIAAVTLRQSEMLRGVASLRDVKVDVAALTARLQTANSFTDDVPVERDECEDTVHTFQPTSTKSDLETGPSREVNILQSLIVQDVLVPPLHTLLVVQHLGSSTVIVMRTEGRRASCGADARDQWYRF